MDVVILVIDILFYENRLKLVLSVVITLLIISCKRLIILFSRKEFNLLTSIIILLKAKHNLRKKY